MKTVTMPGCFQAHLKVTGQALLKMNFMESYLIFSHQTSDVTVISLGFRTHCLKLFMLKFCDFNLHSKHFADDPHLRAHVSQYFSIQNDTLIAHCSFCDRCFSFQYAQTDVVVFSVFVCTYILSTNM